VIKLVFYSFLQKIFLDTTRELAQHTNDLVDEVWNYIKDGKLVHAGVVLIAAQEHIRLASSSKKNGNSKPDGFATIVNRIVDNFYGFDLEMGQNEKELEQPHTKIKYFSSVLLLVNAISQAGKTLHEYIQVHSEVYHFLWSAATVFLLISVAFLQLPSVTFSRYFLSALDFFFFSSFLFEAENFCRFRMWMSLNVFHQF
jgi:hypothetical protein